ncbi:MAG: type II secretion system F family protein [Candidatus Magasanikbacteria bacterium]
MFSKIKKEKQLSEFEIKLNNFFINNFTKIKTLDKVFFLEHLNTMLKAGLSLIESLEVLSKEIENKKFKNIVTDIKQSIEKGDQLSEVLSKYPKVFPPIYVKMIASGEISGKLEESLGQVVLQMKKSYELTSTIKGAMIYPAVILTAISAVGILMVTFVLPKITAMFKDIDTGLPLPTKILVAVTNYLSKPLNLLLIFSLLGIFIFSFIYGLKKSPAFKIFIHNLNLKTPISGKIIKQINLARFSLTMSSLLKSTIPIIEAVEISADICSNVIYKNALKKSAEKIKKGITLSQTLQEYDYLFPPMVTEMIMVGEKTGEIDKLLHELAKFYSNEVDKTMKNFSTIIEPAIILLLGLGVGGIAIAVVMPMYSLTQNF